MSAVNAPIVLPREEETLENVRRVYGESMDRLKEQFPDFFRPEDEFHAYRFLKARDFDEAKAAAMVKASAEFWEKNQMKQIRETVLATENVHDLPHAKEVMKHYPHEIVIGYSKDGSPVSFEHTGKINPSGLFQNVTQDKLSFYILHHLMYNEHVLANVSKEKGRVMRLYHVMDLNGLGIQHVHQGFLMYVRTVSQFGQDNFPEQAEKVFILNAPWLFQTVLNFVKGGVSPATLSKLTVVNPSTADETLSQYFDQPLVDKIKDMMDMEFDHSKSGEIDGASKVTVGAYSKQQFVISLPELEDKNQLMHNINTEFAIDKKDIKVKLYGLRSSGDHKADEDSEILHSFTLSGGAYSKELQISGEMDSLMIEFDNTHSIFTPKTLSYSVGFNSPSPRAGSAPTDPFGSKSPPSTSQ